MKIILFLFLLLTSSTLAQDEIAKARVAPNCGPNNVSFEVKTAKNPHRNNTADAGKALVYILEDDTRFQTFPKPTVRVGVDGNWVGATHGNSYLSFSVEPGEHHLCASWQSYILVKTGDKTAAAHFTAAAGGEYYFRVKDLYQPDKHKHTSAPMIIELQPLDRDEGQLLANTSAISTSHQKK